MMQLRDIEATTALIDLLRADRERAQARQRRIEELAEQHDSPISRELRRQRNDARKMVTFFAVGWLVLLTMWIGVTWFNAHGWPAWLS